VRRENQVDADARDHLRSRVIDSSTLLVSTIIKSASSSITMTM